MSYARPHPTALGTVDVGRMCGVTSKTVRSWALKGLIPCYFLPTEAKHRHARFEKRKVLEFMQQHGIPLFEDV